MCAPSSQWATRTTARFRLTTEEYDCTGTWRRASRIKHVRTELKASTSPKLPKIHTEVIRDPTCKLARLTTAYLTRARPSTPFQRAHLPPRAPPSICCHDHAATPLKLPAPPPPPPPAVGCSPFSLMVSSTLLPISSI